MRKTPLRRLAYPLYTGPASPGQRVPRRHCLAGPTGAEKARTSLTGESGVGADPFPIHMTAHSARPAAKTAMAAAIMFMMATRFDSRIGAAS